VRTALAATLVAGILSSARAQTPPLEHFTVIADGHPLAVWARRPPAPKGAILLVHGRTWSSLPDFDLQVPDESRSVLTSLAARGYAAYAIDLRGYGGTPRDRTGWLTPLRAADDVSAALVWLAGNQKLPTRPVLIGWSIGSMVAQLTAQRHPELLSALVLYGYPFSPGDSIDADPDSTSRPARQHNTREGAASDFTSPSVTSPRMVAAYVKAAMKADPILTDWRFVDQFNALDPARVTIPTLVLQGERDPEPLAALQRLFTGLGTAQKSWITLQGGDHAALLEDTRPLFADAIVSFIGRLKRVP
jgi:pimeloyl-ACP methyl ester carboxylesterase